METEIIHESEQINHIDELIQSKRAEQSQKVNEPLSVINGMDLKIKYRPKVKLEKMFFYPLTTPGSESKNLVRMLAMDKGHSVSAWDLHDGRRSLPDALPPPAVHRQLDEDVSQLIYLESLNVYAACSSDQTIKILGSDFELWQVFTLSDPIQFLSEHNQQDSLIAVSGNKADILHFERSTDKKNKNKLEKVFKLRMNVVHTFDITDQTDPEGWITMVKVWEKMKRIFFVIGRNVFCYEDGEKFRYKGRLEVVTKRKVTALGFDDAKMWIQVGYSCGTIRLYSRDLSLFHTFIGHCKEVVYVATVSSINAMVSAARDNTFRVWNINLMKELFKFDWKYLGDLQGMFTIGKILIAWTHEYLCVNVLNQLSRTLQMFNSKIQRLRLNLAPHPTLRGLIFTEDDAIRVATANQEADYSTMFPLLGDGKFVKDAIFVHRANRLLVLTTLNTLLCYSAEKDICELEFEWNLKEQLNEYCTCFTYYMDNESDASSLNCLIFGTDTGGLVMVRDGKVVSRVDPHSSAVKMTTVDYFRGTIISFSGIQTIVLTKILAHGKRLKIDQVLNLPIDPAKLVAQDGIIMAYLKTNQIYVMRRNEVLQKFDEVFFEKKEEIPCEKRRMTWIEGLEWIVTGDAEGIIRVMNTSGELIREILMLEPITDIISVSFEGDLWVALNNRVEIIPHERYVPKMYLDNFKKKRSQWNKLRGIRAAFGSKLAAALRAMAATKSTGPILKPYTKNKWLISAATHDDLILVVEKDRDGSPEFSLQINDKLEQISRVTSQQELPEPEKPAEIKLPPIRQRRPTEICTDAHYRINKAYDEAEKAVRRQRSKTEDSTIRQSEVEKEQVNAEIIHREQTEFIKRVFHALNSGIKDVMFLSHGGFPQYTSEAMPHPIEPNTPKNSGSKHKKDTMKQNSFVLSVPRTPPYLRPPTPQLEPISPPELNIDANAVIPHEPILTLNITVNDENLDLSSTKISEVERAVLPPIEPVFLLSSDSEEMNNGEQNVSNPEPVLLFTLSDSENQNSESNQAFSITDPVVLSSSDAEKNQELVPAPVLLVSSESENVNDSEKNSDVPDHSQILSVTLTESTVDKTQKIPVSTDSHLSIVSKDTSSNSQQSFDASLEIRIQGPPSDASSVEVTPILPAKRDSVKVDVLPEHVKAVLSNMIRISETPSQKLVYKTGFKSESALSATMPKKHPSRTNIDALDLPDAPKKMTAFRPKVMKSATIHRPKESRKDLDRSKEPFPIAQPATSTHSSVKSIRSNTNSRENSNRQLKSSVTSLASRDGSKLRLASDVNLDVPIQNGLIVNQRRTSLNAPQLALPPSFAGQRRHSVSGALKSFEELTVQPRRGSISGGVSSPKLVKMKSEATVSSSGSSINRSKLMEYPSFKPPTPKEEKPSIKIVMSRSALNTSSQLLAPTPLASNRSLTSVQGSSIQDILRVGTSTSDLRQQLREGYKKPSRSTLNLNS